MKAGKRPSNLPIERKVPSPDEPYFYWAEYAVGVDDPEWRDPKKNISRDHTWECAIETVRAHRDEDLERLGKFAVSARSQRASHELTAMEMRLFGHAVTGGPQTKRIRFWNFVAYVFEGIVPAGCDTRLVYKPNKVSPFVRVNRIQKASKTIAALALVLLRNGVDRELCYHAVYTPGQEEKAHLSEPSKAMDVADCVWPVYMPLHQWSNQG